MMRGRTPQSLPAEMLLAVGFSGLQQARTQGESINLIIKDHHLEPRVLTLLCNWLGRMGPSVRDLRLDTDGLDDAKEHGRRSLNPDSCSCQRKDRSGLL